MAAADHDEGNETTGGGLDNSWSRPQCPQVRAPIPSGSVLNLRCAIP